MKHLAWAILAVATLSAGTNADAKDSEAAASLQAPGSETSVTVPSPPGKAPQASSNLPALNTVPTSPPAASDTPPRREAPGRETRSSTTGSDLFTLRVCNQSGSSARVAVTRRDDSGDGWLIEGWWRVDPSDCAQIGNFPRGWVYYYADAMNGGRWSGSRVNVCVRYPGPFTRYDGGGTYTCRDDERLRGFNGFHIEDGVGTHTWNLNP